MTIAQLHTQLHSLVSRRFGPELAKTAGVQVVRTEPQFGDVMTNVAMVLAKDLRQPPRTVAERLLVGIRALPGIERADVAGPGFINMTLSDEALLKAAGEAILRPQTYRGQNVVAEYSDPNAFKVLHAGHLYTTITGDAISRLVEASGGTVHRVNYGGDVGLHVGRAMWGILRQLGGELPEKLAEVPAAERAAWISRCYVAGTAAYEKDEAARAEIIECNKRVYVLHEAHDTTSAFAKIYWECREWSYSSFRRLYEQLGVMPFERYLPESEVTPIAFEMVKQAASDGVLTKSDGALVYKGEADGLHTRVFLTAAKLPTYEAKELGLAAIKWRDYQFDASLIITANDIIDYMKVVSAVIAHLYPQAIKRTTHLTHGMVKFPGGIKMSSRTGKALVASDILEAAAKASRDLNGKQDWSVIVGAVKYAFLRQRIGGDIIYDPAESVSLEGNSGPYLQYAHARARSIMAKAGAGVGIEAPKVLELDERVLVRKLGEYQEILTKAVEELAPYAIANYLYELAQTFNRFYERNRVVGSDRQAQRLYLVGLYAKILNDGLSLLGIDAPDRL